MAGKMNKICTSCMEDLDFIFFTKDKSKSDGYYSKCKKCCSKKIKLFYINNPGYKALQDKNYYIANKRTIIQRQNKNETVRRKNDINFKLKKNLSRAISFNLNKNFACKNKKSCVKYLGYSMLEFKIYLESKFEMWMNWSNYGSYKANSWDDNDQSTWTWNIDHIIPQSMLPYYSMEDENFKKCWALGNLRPLSAKQNFIDVVTKIRHIK
jgi:hypothetical protein